MYNEELKTMFINSISKQSSQSIALSTFEMISQFESELDKDICYFTEEEIKKVIPKISVALGGTTKRGPRVQALCNYAKWCISEGISGINEEMFANLKGDPTAKIKQYMVKDPQHLATVMNVLFRPVNQTTIDNIYHAAYWLSFCGVEREELTSLQASQIDMGKHTVKSSNGIHHIVPEATDVIKSCLDIKTFKIIHPKYTREGEDPRYDMPEYVLRGTNDLFNPALMQETISRKFKKLSGMGITVPRIKLESVKMSGVFYRMYQDSLRGNPVDFSNEVENDLKRVEYTNLQNKRYSREAFVNMKNNQYIADYNNWLQAFYGK